MTKPHSFHIPVMGIGFTIDTPLKVSHLGIDSVISLVDDILLEKLRKMYSEKYELPYTAITEKIDDFRAKRITAYLNLMKTLIEQKFREMKNAVADSSSGIMEYIDLLSDSSDIKKKFNKLHPDFVKTDLIDKSIHESLSMGSIDVNIMTKLDKENYINDEKLPVEFNDAHAALRGYANSDLNSSLVLSAGMNPRLYSYIENFEDFYPDLSGEIKKKIILKVSDYRSALIQGKFLAKKGLWVSEYRVESGLNCGGHAFATDGFLMGPILAEFRDKREELFSIINDIFLPALTSKNRVIPQANLQIRISAQGGVGTNEEHRFLLDHYNIDSVGWGTPFLLVPEVTSVDPATLEKLIAAREEDLYLSDISPLGVPFNTLRGNTKEDEKLANIAKGRPGSACPKEYVAINNKEFTDRNICTASRQYQNLKIKQIELENFTADNYQDAYEKVVVKSCICVGLGTSALLVNNISTKTEGSGVSICPGPNMAYFSRLMSLKEITSHIYGKINVINRTDRPHMFIKELKLYIDYLKNKIEEIKHPLTDKQEKYLTNFSDNLKDGIKYYSKLFSDFRLFEDTQKINNDLEEHKNILQNLCSKIENLLMKTNAA